MTTISSTVEEEIDFESIQGGVLPVAHIGIIEELDEDSKWNIFIKTGYRINYSTWRQILMSLFEWHNETINIWTHLVGFIVFFIILMIIAFT